MTQTPYAFVPHLILSSSEYTSTLSQSQILNFPDPIGIDYKCLKLLANISISTCYMHMLYLLVIHTSKEFGTYHEAEILSVLHQVSIYPFIRRGKSEGNSQKLQLLSMVQSDSLGTLHLQLFHHKVSSGCVHSCNLPPTSGSARLHSLYNYTRSNCGTDGISQLYIAMAHQQRQNDGNCN